MRAEPHRRIRAVFLTAVFVMCAGLAACSSTTPTNAAPSMQSEAQRKAEALKYVDQAQAAARKGNDEEALELYRHALDLTDSLDSAWNNIGVLLLKQKNYQHAIFAFGRAADLAPSDPRPMTNIGIAYSRAGHAEKALRAFQDALDRDPNWLDALRGAGESTRLLRIANEQSLDRTMHALLIEPDDRWRSFFESEKFRIQRMIEARER